MINIIKTYISIYSIVPSKLKYILILMCFFLISLLDLLSISTLTILLANILGVDVSFEALSYLSNFSQTKLLYVLFLIILFKQCFYLFIFYIFLNYSYNLKNIFINRYVSTSLNYRKISDKKEDLLNFIRIIEEFTFSSLVPSFQFLFELFVILAISGYVIFWDPKSALIIGSIFVFLGLIYFNIVPRIISKLGEKNIKLNSTILKLIGYVNDGIREIIIFNKIKNITTPLNKTLNILKKQLVTFDLLNAIPRVSFEVILILSLGIVFLINSDVSSNFLLNSSIFIFAFTKLIPSLIKFISILNSINYGGYALNKIKETDLEYFKSVSFKNSLDNSLKTFDEIFVENVSIIFKKDKKDEVKINYPNFKIKKNQKILISSKSGKGKSTFLDIFCNFIKPENGNIYMKFNNRKYNFNTNLVNYSPQFNLILDNNFNNNISLSIDETSKKYSNNKLANFFFKDNMNILSDNTIVNASGGEKKRIGLLRTILNKSKKNQIYIFDEPTASLDQINKEEFYNWLKKTKDITIIIASHDKGYEKLFDQIIRF